jgi:hypothetical protein
LSVYASINENSTRTKLQSPHHHLLGLQQYSEPPNDLDQAGSLLARGLLLLLLAAAVFGGFMYNTSVRITYLAP